MVHGGCCQRVGVPVCGSCPWGSSGLPPLTIQYADFAVWQRNWLQGAVLERKLRYWSNQLAGVPPLVLPTDYQRPAVQTYGGSSVKSHLPVEIVSPLRQHARASDATLFMLLLAAWDVVLARHAQQEDIAVGTPTAGRTASSLETLIGFFINTVVIRTSVTNEMLFTDLLSAIRTHTLAALSSQDVPFERIVEVVQPERDQSRNPLFQVMFVLQTPEDAGSSATTQAPSDSDDHVIFAGLERTTTTTKFDLTMFAQELSNGGLSILLEYNTSLFTEHTARMYFHRFETLLKGIASDPSRRLYTYSMATAAEQHMAQIEWNDTSVVLSPYVRNETMHAMFETAVDANPDAPCIITDDLEQPLTYAEVEARANQLASWLQGQGVGPEIPVVLVVERGVEMLVGQLGILKAGGCYVPCDPSFPRQRTAFIIDDCETPVMLTLEHLRSRLPAPPHITVLSLDADWKQVISSMPTGRPSPVCSSADLAYIIYTSGSTGQPKGVMLQHQGVVNRVRWLADLHPLHPFSDVVMQKTPYVFDVSVAETFWPLLNGALLAYTRPGGHTDPLYLAEFIVRRAVTVLHFVPSMLDAFCAVIGEEWSSRFAGVRLAWASGEALPVRLSNAFHVRFPSCTLYDLYGPTEASIEVLWYRCEPRMSRTLR